MERHDALYLASMTSNIQVLMDVRSKIDEKIEQYIEEMANEAWFAEEYEQIVHPNAASFLDALSIIRQERHENLGTDYDPYDPYEKRMD